MRFHHKIILLALVVAALATGVSGVAADTARVADPGWWLALGEGLIGASENGWCSCG
ncbi:hypothetical protein [Marimonas lutisalis]|uniref:hypothetical protein n=1 Tax=Marimonas lutisalis TaxID=2545756 RepID=UPI001376410D|nr:hypothetical protein [Marimonas lutisalis]